MMIDFKDVKQRIKKASTILLTTHIEPDADGIGSQIGLYLALKSLGKKVYCVNEENLSARYSYLEGKKKIIQSYDEFVNSQKILQIDLIIIVDTGNLHRIGDKMQNLIQDKIEYLFIDHHPKTRKNGHHLIDSKASATGEIIGELIKSLSIPFTKEMALPLYTAILIDTSSFRYPTVTPRTHRLIADFMDTGINPARAYDLIYGTKKIGHMRLLGEILKSAEITDDGQIAWITVSSAQLKKYDCPEEDTFSFVNYLLVLYDIKMSLMFRSYGNKVKVSIRSAGIIDVNPLAESLGGGGHNHSAAAVIKGKLQDIVPDIVNKCQEHLKNTK